MALQFHYKCDDIAATTVVLDSSGNANDGTLADNTDELSVSGPAGPDFKAFANNSGVGLTASGGSSCVSFAGWFSTVNANGGIYESLVHGFGTQGEELMLLCDGSSSYLNYTIDDNTTQTTSPSFTVQSDVPFHLALVNNGSDEAIVYINGENIGLITTGNAGLTVNIVGGLLFADISLSGIMDDLRGYDNALTPEEVSALYALGASSFVPAINRMSLGLGLGL